MLRAEPASATVQVSVLQADRGKGSRQETQLRELQAQLVAKAREVRAESSKILKNTDSQPGVIRGAAGRASV